MVKTKRKLWKTIVGYCCVALVIYVIAGFISTIPINKTNTTALPDTTLLRLSEDFLYKVKTEEPTAELENDLAKIELKHLIDGLNNDNAIKAFWINMYNAWYQILASREKLNRPKIFTDKKITIASKKFSLDDIEHGILRKYRWKLGMGYLPKFFPGKLIKQLSVFKIDYRIHFTLNCGATSCPPIAFYSYADIDKQLDMATKSFLSSETEFDDGKKVVSVTKIMDWFVGDFGGKKGIRRIVKEVLKKDVDDYKLKFKAYNWDAALHNFNDDGKNP